MKRRHRNRYIALAIAYTASLPATPLFDSANGDPATGGANELASSVLAVWRQLVPAEGNSGAMDTSLRYVIAGDGSCGDLVEGERRPWSRGTIPRSADERGGTVTVCELRLPADAASIELDEQLYEPYERSDDRDKIVVFGDTGCRVEIGQRCDGDDDWPFPLIAKTASESPSGGTGPDLVIHLGDFRYRGSDDWRSWQVDFFGPAEPLLSAAPWVMVRGNHEVCYKDKGEAWLRLFGIDRGEVIRTCPRDADRRPVVQRPYALDVAPSLRLVVLDTANSFHRCMVWDSDFGRPDDSLRTHAAVVRELVDAAAEGVWLLSHYPILNVEEDASGKCAENKPGYLLRDRFDAWLTKPREENKVSAIFSGDLHQFQALQYRMDGSLTGPVQFVVGNGGAWRSAGVGLRIERPDPVVDRRSKANESAGGDGDGFPEEARCFREGKHKGQPIQFSRRVTKRSSLDGEADCRFGFVVVSRMKARAADDGEGSKEWQASVRSLDEHGEFATREICEVPPRTHCVPGEDKRKVVQLARTGLASYEQSPKAFEGKPLHDGNGKEIGTIVAVRHDGRGNLFVTTELEEIVRWGTGTLTGKHQTLPWESLRFDGDRGVLAGSAALKTFEDDEVPLVEAAQLEAAQVEATRRSSDPSE